jgi:RimJ/RimL family protein N-acetyltransferase
VDQPTIPTARLILRPFQPGDAEIVQKLAGEREVADTTLNIPHPYEDGIAEAWLATHKTGFEDGTLAVFAIVLRESGQLVGAIGLEIDRRFKLAELGYWIGKPFWNRGYATEAAIGIIRYGFTSLELNRIASRHFTRNPASGRVMQKAGMQHEGMARQSMIKWGKYEDLQLYAILREDWSGA